MEVDIQNAKIDLIQWLISIEDSSTIQKIIELRNSEKENCNTKSSDAEKKSVELGIIDADNGKLKPHSEAKKIYEKWL